MLKTLAAGAAILLLLCATSAQAASASCANLEKGKLRSKNSDKETEFSIYNAGSTPRVLNWIDYDGQAKTYAVLKPGEGLEQPSYRTHVWAVLDQVGNCKNVYRLGDFNLNIRLSD